MADKPTQRRWQVPWPAVIFAAVLMAYTGGYFALSKFEAGVPASSGLALPASSSLVFPAYRYVEHEWMLRTYEPLRRVESYLRGKPVELIHAQVPPVF